MAQNVIPQILPPTAMQAAAAQAAQNQSPMVPMNPAPSPGSPAGVAANSAQWAKAIDMITQPGAVSALLQFGGMAVQPRAPGQSHAGQVGKALMGTMQGQIGLQQNQREAENAKSVRENTAARTRIAQENLGVQKEALQFRKEEAEKAEKIRLEGLPLQQRYEEARIKLVEAQTRAAGRTTSSTSATNQETMMLAEALFRASPDKYDSSADAILDAHSMATATQGKTREQSVEDFAKVLLGNTVDPTPEEAQQAIALATDMVNSIRGGGTDGKEYREEVPAAMQAAAEGPYDPVKEKDYDRLFGPGKYAALRAKMSKSGGF